MNFLYPGVNYQWKLVPQVVLSAASHLRGLIKSVYITSGQVVSMVTVVSTTVQSHTFKWNCQTLCNSPLEMTAFSLNHPSLIHCSWEGYCWWERVTIHSTQRVICLLHPGLMDLWWKVSIPFCWEPIRMSHYRIWYTLLQASWYAYLYNNCYIYLYLEIYYLSLCMQHPFSDSEHPHNPSSEQSVGSEYHLWLL